MIHKNMDLCCVFALKYNMKRSHALWCGSYVQRYNVFVCFYDFFCWSFSSSACFSRSLLANSGR